VSLKDPLARRIYTRDWKRRKRRELNLPTRGKYLRKERTDKEKEISKEKRRLYEIEWNKNHPYSSRDNVDRLLWAAKKRAKNNNLPFDITRDDIVIPELCPYLNIPLVHSRPRGSPRRDIASIDRIIPEKGYVKGNIEVISWLANTMKNNATPELLLEFAHTILERHRAKQ